MRACVAIVALLLVPALAARAAEHPSLAQARALYNAGDDDAAIAAAEIARSDPASADAAALVAGRAYLQRYRRGGDAADLISAREALGSVRAPAVSPRDRVDLLVGLGQSLYETDAFGAAAELFDTALSRAELLDERDRLMLLDWWATALDRAAARRAPGDRAAVYERIVARMQDEVRQDPGSPPANYWLAVAAGGAGDLERAWAAAVAGWVRAALRPDAAASLREDLDQFVTDVLIPARVRGAPEGGQEKAQQTLREEWDVLKASWQ